MQIALHAGAHFTEEDRVMKCLLRNKDIFGQAGVAVPGPGRYRQLLRDTVMALRDAPPAEDARDVLMDAILDHEIADRMVLSHPHLFGVARFAVRDGRFYPEAPQRLAQLAALFPDDGFDLFLAIRNPATFLPAAAARAEGRSFAEFMGDTHPQDLRWSDLIGELRAHAPEVPVTVWCNEDAPLVWEQIIREIGGLDHGTEITGAHDLLDDIMSPEGLARFGEYLQDHPQMNEMQKRRVIAAFLDKFALEDAVEQELDLPGWTGDMIDALTEQYDEDALDIARIPGVQVISP